MTAFPISDVHRGMRWQVAKCNVKDPDEFAKDIYFGVLNSAPEPPADAGSGESTPPEAFPPKDGDPDGDGEDAQRASATIDPDEIAFKNRVEQTMSTLKAIYRSVEPREVRSGLSGIADRLHNLSHVRTEAQKAQRSARFNEAYDRLFGIAVLGLGTQDTQEALRRKVSIASGALDGLRADVRAREAAWIKNGYMKKLGIPALMAGLLFALLFLVYEKSPGFFTSGCNAGETLKWLLPDNCTPQEGGIALFPNELYYLRHLFLLMAGCMMGTWASFAARNVVLTFDDLAELEQDSLSPVMRLTFTGVLTLIFALIFVTGMIQVEVGGFKTAELTRDGTVAFLAGAFFGLLEQRLPAAIMDKAKGFMDAASGK